MCLAVCPQLFYALIFRSGNAGILACTWQENVYRSWAFCLIVNCGPKQIISELSYIRTKITLADANTSQQLANVTPLETLLWQALH